MAKREWNDHQRQGIEARGGSLLLSAAAGSGKTAVLVERVLRRITDPKEAVDIDRLLIVTFTRAAAAEMRQRLSAALAELSAADPENLLYQKQQMLLPQASISTVHSFCTSLLREQATVAGLPVGFKVAEDAQALLLASQALDEVLEESYRRRDPAFLALATQLNSQRNDRGLRQAVEQTYTFMQAQPHPERWLQEQVDAYTQVQPLENSRWFSFACGELEILLEGCHLLARRALAAAQEGGLEGYLPALMLDVRRIEGLCPLPQGIGYDDLRRQLEGLKPERLPPVKTQDAAQMEAKEQVKSLRDSLRKKLERVRGLLPCDEAACREDLAAMAPLVGALGDLVTAYTQRFTQLKRRQKLLDYNDLEHECLTLLLDEADNPTPLAEELSARYEEIMVDEYQDTNAAQDTLFRAISRGENNLFMVGDVKQSIYGFRQAMPTIFTGRRAAYTPYEKATPVFPAALSLERNYRSRYEVTETVNFLFRQVMHRRLGGVEYGEGEALVCAAAYPEGAGYETEWLLCDRAEEGACLPQDVLEARLIGRRIQELQGSLLIGQENRRPLEYGDICILFRARTHMAAYAKELNRMGIPTATEENGSFLSTPEIRCALSLLRVIDNPLREVELTAVMLSPVYGFTADECALVRLKGGTGRKAPPLYSALSLVAPSDNTHAAPALYEKCQRLLSDLSQYRTLAVSLPADRLLERLLRDTGLEAVFAARPGGSQRVANLHQLDRVARGFEQGGFRGLSAFVRYVDLLEEQGRDLPAGSAQRQDGVRLMTMHASKGLEFPVVFLARLGGLSGGDKTAKLLFHHEAGIGMQLWDEQDLDKHTTLPFCGVRSARRQDEQAEELRVWYVAMTRAREKLILVYTAKNLHKKMASLEAELPREDRLMTDTVLCATAPGDWLLAAALRHPDFAAARGARSGLLSCDCRWQVEEQTDALLEEENTVADAAVTISPDEALASLLRERLAFQYPYAPLAAVPAMLAASQLSHEAMSRDHVAAARPAFLQREGLTPAGRGTAHHTFMQFADFAAACEDLEGEIARLLAAGFITDQQAAALDRNRLSAFLQSPLYARMAASPDCRREYHFILTVPAGSLTQLPPEMASEPVVVQGIADCVFREGDRLVLVDYKTDRVKTPEELVERYRSQMSFYKQAMETLLGLPVSQVLLYSFALGGTIEVK